MQNNQPLLSLGSTELGRIVKESSGTIQGTTLQIPTTGYHTVEETASVLSIKTVLFILKIYILRKKNKIVKTIKKKNKKNAKLLKEN